MQLIVTTTRGSLAANVVDAISTQWQYGSIYRNSELIKINTLTRTGLVDRGGLTSSELDRYI